MIAVRRLQSIFWVLLVTMGAIAVYLVSLRVASERTELARVERQILAAKHDIRYLETEFGARASMRQLERWNSENFRFSTPTAVQYLNGEKALASLEGITPNGPAYVATPVMTAMVETPADVPASAAKAISAPAPVRAETADRAIPATPAPTPTKAASIPAKPVEARPVRVAVAVAKPAPVIRRAERMAMLEQKLLDDHTMGDLARLAARETGRVMR